MSRRRSGRNGTLSPAANDNAPGKHQKVLEVEVLVPANLPILQVEVEVFAALLDDWPVANDDQKT
jgi:hypothetical protein